MTDDAADGVGDTAGSDAEQTSGAAADSFEAAVTGDDAVNDDAYSGLLGAFPYAFRASQSWLFKSYALVGGVLALSVAVLFGLSLVVLLGQTAAAAGGSFTFSRAFFVFVGFLLVAPLVAPVLFVARRHRREVSTRGYDARLAGFGYLFVASLFVGGVITAPAENREAVTGSLAPLVEFLYGLPAPAGLFPLFAAAVLIWRAGRRPE